MNDNSLTLGQKLLIAAVAGALVGMVGVLAQHHLTKFVAARSVRRIPLPRAR